MGARKGEGAIIIISCYLTGEQAKPSIIDGQLPRHQK
jgi:hypothetical protein